ncbi:hypothetical protein HHI36_024326 [Cryptolaemus montrouzieri]|uniref:Uncharacterized protein n=1 Tax=Cryptolaemus montrouzieri TaxID=559131 RepID=A0ABD2NPG6_9CUCU
MSIDRPGGTPRVDQLLSPQAREIYTQRDSPSPPNFSILINELEALKNQASIDNDASLINEINLLSQSINQQPPVKKPMNFKYKSTDKGPYTVIVESIQKNIGNLNPMNIGKIIYTNNYNNLYIVSINRKGLKRVGIQFSTANQANDFIEKNHFNKTEYEVYIPARMVTVMGIVRDVGTQITEDDIVNYGRGINPNTKIVRVRRFNRRIQEGDQVKYVPTNTCLLTFADSHEDEKPCDSSPCCIYCKNEHYATDRQCSEYKRQMKIREVLAYYNVSFYEANQACKTATAPSPSAFPSRPHSNSEQNNYSRSSNSRPLNISYADICHNTNKNLSRANVHLPSQPNQKRKSHLSPGYNKELHNECLINYTPLYSKRPYKSYSTESPSASPIIFETSALVHQQDNISTISNTDNFNQFDKDYSKDHNSNFNQSRPRIRHDESYLDEIYRMDDSQGPPS